MTKTKPNASAVRIVPQGDRILIRETSKEDKKTAGGIIIPEGVKGDKNSRRGTVVAVGKGRYEDGKLVPVSISVGDEVLFSWGDELSLEGVEYALVRESEILAIIKNS